MSYKVVEKIKILFVVPSLRRAGAQTQLVDLICGMDKVIFDQYLFTFESQLEQLRRIDQQQVKFYNKQRRFKYDIPAVAQEIAAIVDSEGIDIIHCTQDFALLMGWLARRFSRTKPKLCVTIHTTLSGSNYEELKLNLCYRWLWGTCDSVTFVCENQRNYLMRRFPGIRSDAVTIHNGVDVSYYNPDNFIKAGEELRTSLGISRESTVLSCIARFRPEKGHLFLINAFAKLEESCHLILAGDGEMQAEIEERISILGISSRVHFLGSVDDVRPVLSTSDLSVLASFAVETFSMAMLESMAMQTPMLATDIGGMNEAIFPGKTGDLAPPGNEHILYEKMSALAANKQLLLEMGIAARKLVEERFSIENMVEMTQTEFKRVGAL